MENKPFNPDKLHVLTQANYKHSKQISYELNGTVRLQVRKADKDSPVNEIAIENTYRVPVDGEKMRETALVNITFADGSQFTGNFDELKRAADANRLLFNLVTAYQNIDPASTHKYMLESISLMDPK